MHYIRLMAACAAMLLSWLCFDSVSGLASAPEPQAARVRSSELTEQLPADTLEAVAEAVGTATMYTPMAGRHLDETPLPLHLENIFDAASADVSEMSDTEHAAEADRYYVCDADGMRADETRRSETSMKEEIAAREAEEARRRAEEERLRAEEERRRIAREKEEQDRRIAARKAAREAALREACPGYDAEFIALLTAEEQAEARYFYEQGYVFYRQNWSVLDDQYYGNEGFGLCGCGPTCIAAVISNLAGVPVDPEEMRVYGLSVGSWLPSGGTTYGFLIETAKKYGISTTQIYAGDKESLFAALRDENKLVLATMGPGDFTLGAHFMLFRGITDEGKILIADSYSYEHSIKEWDYEDLYAQLKTGYWIFEKTN